MVVNMKKPNISELTLREKIGQTALMQSPQLMALDNTANSKNRSAVGFIR